MGGGGSGLGGLSARAPLHTLDRHGHPACVFHRLSGLNCLWRTPSGPVILIRRADRRTTAPQSLRHRAGSTGPTLTALIHNFSSVVALNIISACRKTNLCAEWRISSTWWFHGRLSFITAAGLFLGKSLASAALGALLQARGYKSGCANWTPISTSRPGTMSPHQHASLCDRRRGRDHLDLAITTLHRVSSGKAEQHHQRRIYQQSSRRAGAISRRTVQVPARHRHDQGIHTAGSEDVDSCFARSAARWATSKAFRSSSHPPARQRMGRSITLRTPDPVPYLEPRRLKTKPTQHSVKSCAPSASSPYPAVPRRMPIPDDEPARSACSATCRPARHPALDLSTIYQVPLAIMRSASDNESSTSSASRRTAPNIAMAKGGGPGAHPKGGAHRSSASTCR